MSDTVYDELGVPTIVNAAGTKTRLGGPPMRPEAADAMRGAANASARISDLQARASELIAGATGAEAGYVTTGASSALTLAAAACIAGDDLGVMSRLPETEGVASEIAMPRINRNGYDHAFRLAGATIVDVGMCDHTLGVAATNVEPWELEDAISEETVAVGYLPRPATQLPLETVVEIAHARNVAVIVDGAANLPPKANLARYVEAGADLVAFSGGKAIRGPQATGVLAGRRDLIRSVALQHLDMDVAETAWAPPEELFGTDEVSGVPRHGIGRGFKTGKEELVGLIRALELFVEEDEAAVAAEMDARAERIADGLAGEPALDARVVRTEGVPEGTYRSQVIPGVVVEVDEGRAGTTAAALVRALRREDPKVFVGDGDVAEARFSVSPVSLSDELADYVVERIRANL